MREYHIFNLLILLIILAACITIKLDLFTVTCVYSEAGESCKTCGLTRAFHSALSGNTQDVPAAFLFLFILLAVQVFLRPAISILLAITKRLKLIRNIDITATVVLFVLFLFLL